MRGFSVSSRTIISAAAALMLLAGASAAQETTHRLGGSYSTLDSRQQRFVDDWVGRFSAATGKAIQPADFYDGILRISTKTTFDAITHALEMTELFDESGRDLGDALALIDRVDTVRGKVLGAGSDRQFRMYVGLTARAVEILESSRQFKRRGDNTSYHPGYPINFRGEGGPPSIQFSVALDRRHADVDVDYRSSSFPMSLLNGHLTAANSDVRAGNNYDRHSGQWSGLNNWWRNFFGISLPGDDKDDAAQEEAIESRAPRAGDKRVDVMMADFLHAWLVEGDIKAAMSYVSRRAFACLADESEDLSTVDRGIAPFVIAHRLKASHDVLAPQQSIEGVTVGVRLVRSNLKLVKQPHHGQFVVYKVPDDAALAFECENRSGTLGSGKREYGNYFAATFYIKGPQAPTSVALLWARDDGFWRIVSWQADPEGDGETPAPAQPPVATPVRIAADASLVDAAHGFLESWLVRRDFAAAFSYVSQEAYPCYNLIRGANQPAAATSDEAATGIRLGMELIAATVGNVRTLADVVSAAPPVHPAVRIMNHRYSSTFAVSSIPNALVEAVNCQARLRGDRFSDDGPAEYGRGFGVTVRFRIPGGEPSTLRMLWMKENGAWRITAYDVEAP